MKRKGVKMVFKPNEFKYFLFNKKVCNNPIIISFFVPSPTVTTVPIGRYSSFSNNLLKRIVKKEYVGKEATVQSTPLDMYEFKNFYYCDFCKQEYSLTELSERRKNK